MTEPNCVYGFTNEGLTDSAGVTPTGAGIAVVLVIAAFLVGILIAQGSFDDDPPAAQVVNQLCGHHGGVAPGWDGGYRAVCKDGTAVQG